MTPVTDKTDSVRENLIADRVAELEKAVGMLLHAVCHETGFAAAVRQDSGFAYPWPALDQAEQFARSILGEKP